MRTVLRPEVLLSVWVLSAVGCGGGAGTTANGGSSSTSGGKASGDGGSSNGGTTTTNGGVTSGGSTNGGSTNGGSTNGGTTNGGSTNGGSTNGGTTNGGTTNGGTTNGGTTNGGTTNGGSTNGGSTNGGTSNGGSTSGGSSNGGSSNGGSSNGGSTTTSGGTSSGGRAATGGTATSTGGTTTSSGGSGTGGTATSSGGTTTGTGGSGGASACGSVTEQIGSVTVTAPEGVKPGWRNYRVWGSVSLNIDPVYVAPMANCGTLVCYTTGTGVGTAGTRRARVARLDANDQLVTTHDLGAFECRGIAAEPDGHFAALLWAPGSVTTCNDYTQNGRIYVSRFDASGAAGWSKELTNTSTTGLGPNCPTLFDIGESRLEFGGGKYGAYYHVHSQSGHEGDTLKYVDTAGTESTTWSWGCSHSMSNVLRFNPTDAKFMPACVTDCYPGTTSSDFTTGSIGGVYLSNKTKVIDVDAGCNGSVAGELGSGAIAPSGWKLVFNAHQNAATMGASSYNSSTMNQDIGFASITSTLAPSGGVVWLTSTASLSEADSSIERFKRACDSTEQYLVGWSEPGTAYKYKLGRVSATGTFIENPVDVTAQVKWGRRDDPFRAHVNGDIVWAWFDSAGSTSLRFARVRSGGSATCAAF
ncbi:MAG: hypothetical protein QM756_04555 [Polyangiaceae bacterium]